MRYKYTRTGVGGGGSTAQETLESVSLCTRFSGFSMISSFSFNRKAENW